MALCGVKERTVRLKPGLSAGAQCSQPLPFLWVKVSRIKSASGYFDLLPLKPFQSIRLHSVFITQRAVVQRLHIGRIGVIGQICLYINTCRWIAGFGQGVFSLAAQGRQFIRIWLAASPQQGFGFSPAILRPQRGNQQRRYCPCGSPPAHQRTKNRFRPRGIPQGKGALSFVQAGGLPFDALKFTIKRAGAGVFSHRHEQVKNSITRGKVAGFPAQIIVEMPHSRVCLPFQHPDTAKNEFVLR